MNQYTFTTNKCDWSWKIEQASFHQKMKNRHLLFLIVGLALTLHSCSSGEDPQPESDWYVKFQANGTAVAYSIDSPIQPMGFSLDQSTDLYLASTIILGEGSDGTRDFFNIYLWNNEPFVVGQSYEMQDLVSINGAPSVRIHMNYADSEGNLYNAILRQREIAGMKITDDASLRFTAITPEYVEGVFTGNLLGPMSNVTGRGDEELVISSGIFRLPLVNQIP